MLQGVPLLYVPLEVVMSKYYGESERLLGTIFSLANELSDGAIIFLDEVLWRLGYLNSKNDTAYIAMPFAVCQCHVK